MASDSPPHKLRSALWFEGFDLHEYRDGRVSRLWICFDMAAIARDLGVLPPIGSRAERLTVHLANLQNRLRR